MRGSPVRFADLSGGISYDSEPYVIQASGFAVAQYDGSPVMAADARNVVADQRGSLHKRRGSTLLATLPAGTKITGLMSFQTSPSATPKIVATTNLGGIYSVDWITGAVTDIKGAFSTAANPSAEPTFAIAPQGGAATLLAMTRDWAFSWTGTSNVINWPAAGAGVPLGAAMTTWRNRVYVASGSTNRSRVWFSDINTSELFMPTGFVDLDPHDSDEITAIAALGPYLVAFKRNKTYVIYDDATGANRTVSDSIGCVGQDCIGHAQGRLYLKTTDNKIVTFDGSRFEDISRPISSRLTRSAAPVSSRDVGVVFDDHYYYVPGSGVQTMYDLDTRSGAWWRHTLNMSKMRVVGDALGVESLIGGDAGGVSIYRLFQNVYTDAGVNYNARWISKPISLQQDYRKFRVRRLTAWGSGGGVACQTYANYDLGSVLRSSDLWPGSTAGEPLQARIHTLGVFNAIAVQFEAVTATDFIVNSFTLHNTLRND